MATSPLSKQNDVTRNDFFGQEGPSLFHPAGRERLGKPSLRKASMDLMARSSVVRPIAVLMASTSTMAMASVQSPNSPAIAAAPASSHTTGPLSWLTKIATAVTGG